MWHAVISRCAGSNAFMAPMSCVRNTSASDQRPLWRLGLNPAPAAAWLFRQPEHFFRFEEPSHRVKAERDKRTRANPRKGARYQDWAQQAFGQPFDPRGE